MSTELMATVARVRRAMPRNGDVMALCDTFVRMITERAACNVTAAVTPACNVTECAACAARRAQSTGRIRKHRAKSARS
jgi:hypothetical protein